MTSIHYHRWGISRAALHAPPLSIHRGTHHPCLVPLSSPPSSLSCCRLPIHRPETVENEKHKVEDIVENPRKPLCLVAGLPAPLRAVVSQPRPPASRSGSPQGASFAGGCCHALPLPQPALPPVPTPRLTVPLLVVSTGQRLRIDIPAHPDCHPSPLSLSCPDPSLLPLHDRAPSPAANTPAHPDCHLSPLSLRSPLCLPTPPAA